MKRYVATALIGTAMALSGPVFAQTTTTPATPAPADAPAATTPPAVTATPATPTAPAITVTVPEGYTAVMDWSGYTLDQLKGADVHGPAGEKVGNVEDVVVGADGKVTGIVADIGGFLGIGSHRAEISGTHAAVYTNADGKAIVATDMTKDALKSLPAYVKP